MGDGIFVWGSGMTVASGYLDAGGLEVDAVGIDGCGGVGSGAAGWIRVLSRGVVMVVAMGLENGRV